MSLAALFNIPDSDESLSTFSFHNQDHHRQIVDALYAKGVSVQLAPIDPIPPDDAAGWLRTHQAMHADFTTALGIGGSDLTDVDWRDKGQLASWVQLHADEHRQAADLLGLT